MYLLLQDDACHPKLVGWKKRSNMLYPLLELHTVILKPQNISWNICLKSSLPAVTYNFWEILGLCFMDVGGFPGFLRFARNIIVKNILCGTPKISYTANAGIKCTGIIRYILNGSLWVQQVQTPYSSISFVIIGGGQLIICRVRISIRINEPYRRFLSQKYKEIMPDKSVGILPYRRVFFTFTIV